MKPLISMDLQEQIKDMDQCLSRRREQLYRRLLTNACKGLTFSQDVMWEMGPDSIPYSKADFSWLFCASGPLAPSTRSKSRKQGVMKCLPHHARPRGSMPPPFPVLTPLQTIHHHSLTTSESFLTEPFHQDGIMDSVKRIGISGSVNVYSIIPNQFPDILEKEERSNTSKCKESVLKKPAKNTAQWIVSQQIPTAYQNKARLPSVLKDKKGSKTDESEGKEDVCGFHRVSKSSTQLRTLQSSKPETPLPVNYSHTTKSNENPFRKSGGSSKLSYAQTGINRTADDMAISHVETPILPCPEDSLNLENIGKYIYHTKNSFELELYTGIAEQVHQPVKKDQSHIVMDSNSECQKNLQEMFPCGPEKWTVSQSAVVNKEMGRLEKGVWRWVGLPTKADYATGLEMRYPEYNRQDTKVAKQPVHYSPIPGLSSLRYAVEGWSNAWKIKTSWQSVTVEGLKKDLTDLHCQVRMAAIATFASRAVNRLEVGQDPDETVQYGQSYDVEAVPPELQPLLLFALDDPVKRVQLAAAVCQYAIGTPNAHARDILRKTLQHDSSGTGVDGWVSAQCLAIEGEASQTVIERLMSQLFLSNTPLDQEQATLLLVCISRKTILVCSLLGEVLNCADRRTRFLACKTISELKCPINKDLTNKLLYLMWNDWSGLVRQVAAQALDKLGLGRDVHNELSVKLREGPTPWRVKALILIDQLKIMTDKLLPSFLHCLNDDFVVVRKQACLTAASLMIKDEMMQNQLLHLMQNDSSCDVKVAAIHALGRIGWLTPMLQELLLWALQYEEEPNVRIAACEALKMLEVKGPELQGLLQERVVLETNAQAHRHIEDLMKHYGYSLDKDKGHMITQQVQKLCTKSNTIEKLLLLEDLKQQTQRKTQRKANCKPVITSAPVHKRLKHWKIL